MIDKFIEEAKANDPGENFLIHYLKSSLSNVEIHDEITLLFFAGELFIYLLNPIYILKDMILQLMLWLGACMS